MKAVVQRVKHTALAVDDRVVTSILYGLVVYLCVMQGDTEQQAERMAYKIANLRIFEDEAGKMNLSVKDVGGNVMVISQFTLAGDCSHGNRPSFSTAEQPERAKELYELCTQKLCEQGLVARQGVFGADMKIAQLNDGPVSIILEI